MMNVYECIILKNYFEASNYSLLIYKLMQNYGGKMNVNIMTFIIDGSGQLQKIIFFNTFISLFLWLGDRVDTDAAF